MAALEAQVQLVEVKADAQAASGKATEVDVAKMKSVVDEAIGKIERRIMEVEARALAAASPRASFGERPSEGYIPQKELMPKSFNDKPEDWRAWREDVLDWIDAVNPGVKEVLEDINKWDDWDEFELTLLMQGKSERVKKDKTQLWRALKRVTDGESKKVVTSTKGEDGFKAWYALNRRFEPSVSARHGVVMADFTGMVGRPAKTPGELQTLMTDHA